MAGTSTWRTISDATEEILRRQRAAAAPGAGAVPAARARPGPVAPGSGMGAHYAALYAPPPDDLAALRRQQAEFARTTQDLDRQNRWMAIPALAPAAAVVGLEAAAAIAARSAPVLGPPASLTLERVGAVGRGGNIYEARVGRLAHQRFKGRVAQKQTSGWESEPTLKTESGVMRPDALGPKRNWDPDNANLRFALELKPNTPTGRAAGARAIKRYTDATGYPARVVYYNPKNVR